MAGTCALGLDLAFCTHLFHVHSPLVLVLKVFLLLVWLCYCMDWCQGGGVTSPCTRQVGIQLEAPVWETPRIAWLGEGALGTQKLQHQVVLSPSPQLDTTTECSIPSHSVPIQ